jgi:hypothetical protein
VPPATPQAPSLGARILMFFSRFFGGPPLLFDEEQSHRYRDANNA